MVVKSDLVCELCQVSCSSGLTMQQHLRGRPHKAKLVWMKQKQSCPREKNRPRPRCDVCQIWCSDWDAMGMHLKGQKHKAKMQESENGGRIVAKKPVRCELCLVNCMNEDLFKMHLKGRQHATRQEMKRRGMIWRSKHKYCSFSASTAGLLLLLLLINLVNVINLNVDCEAEFLAKDFYELQLSISFLL